MVLSAGPGLAGPRGAETLRAEGFAGRVTLVGDEPIGPYERPALSKEFLAGTRDEASLLLRRPGFWDDRGIELMLSTRVTSLDPARRTAQTSRGDELRFDRLLLTTGARPRRLPLETPAGVHELRTLSDATRLRSELAPGTRLVVIGGGFVGAEVASTARALGCEVTIIEAAPAPLERALGAEAGLLLANRWREHGINVRLHVGAAHLRSDASGRVTSLLLTDGTELRADVVLVAVGVEPARDLLPERPAVHVNAAGDVVGPGHWTAAFADGAAAAHRIVGLPAAPPPPPYVWSDQFGLRLQIVGAPAPSYRFEVDGDSTSFTVHYIDETDATRAALFANRPREAAQLRRDLAAAELPCAA